MLTTIGKRSPEEPTMRDRLVDCHARIRKFCALAKRLSEGGPAEQARDAAAQLYRYFSVALPLHIRDEEESVRPRLERLGDSAIASALEAMANEHVAADAALGELVEAWSVIAREPTAARCAGTSSRADWLERHMIDHLANEETRIFPALDLLPRAEWDVIVAEMQARRR